MSVKRAFSILVVLLGLLAFAAGPTFAEGECSACKPWWHLTSSVRPAGVAPGGEGTIVVGASNLGDAPTSEAITLSDVLPAGVSVVENGGKPEVGFYAFFGVRDEANLLEFYPSLCTATSSRVTCTLPDEPSEGFPAQRPYENIEMRIAVKVASTSGVGEAEVSGGGAAPVSLKQSVSQGGSGFGVERYEIVPEEAGGAVDAQAGSHPYQLTSTLALNQTADPLVPPALPKNLQFKLPPGLVGNATLLPQCSDLDFKEIVSQQSLCPGDTVVGVANVTFDEPKLGLRTWPLPLFNLVPEHGEPARFGFTVLKTPVVLDTSVRAGSDYGVTVSVSNVSEVINFLATSVTFWGVPGEPSHNESRGWECLAGGTYESRGESCPTSSQASQAPFLTLPTSCTSPFSTSVAGESWPFKATAAAAAQSVPLPEQGYSLTDPFGRALALTGCNGLPFAPSIETAPDVRDASSPSGLTVHVRVPGEAGENPLGVASSSVKDITVALPAGIGINPAGAGGLEACAEGQVGFESGQGSGGFEELNPQTEPGVKTPLFTPTLPEALSPGLNLGALGFCPNASKVGTVKIKSPLIANPLEGSIYLASQDNNPFGSLVAMYIVAEDPVSGTLVKLPGKVTLCEAVDESVAGMSCQAVGQLITTFEDEPQLPFEDAELHFFGGERAPLSTPAHCGTYTTQASFAPWSGSAPVPSTSSFQITTGPDGGPCPGAALPFSPELTAGMINNQAGSFSPFTLTMSREDGQQNLKSLQLRMPPGLSGILTGVPLCGEAQANAGTCPAASQIGETTVSVGVGGDPYTVKGGKVYLTGPYAGAPFGLSIVNPAVIGSPAHPTFDLGNVIVRARIEINPTTAALTVTSNETGPYAIPPEIDGIPLQIKHVNVTITRSGFTFNPTNCNPLAITGTLDSVEGSSQTLSVPFQATNCATLKFTPKFSVTTSGKTSKAKGASLTAKVTEPAGAIGTQANITRVKVDLPKQLPSRLTTLQKACTNKQFEANPAGCSAASKIGYAKVTTPLLPVPLEGPAIFVSHGGEAFPSLTIVLQGYGVTVDLVGTTNISHAGITSTTFKTVPDVPFNTFTLTLPQGKYSALAANGNLCKPSTIKTVKKKVKVKVKARKKTETRKVKETIAASFQMPTEFIAQNGAAIHETTAVAVTGCGKEKPAKKKEHGKKGGGKKRQPSH